MLCRGTAGRPLAAPAPPVRRPLPSLGGEWVRARWPAAACPHLTAVLEMLLRQSRDIFVARRPGGHPTSVGRVFNLLATLLPFGS